MIYFSKNLKYLRELRGLKQSEIPDYTRFSQTAWNNYEKGVSKPKFDDLIEISNFFGVSESDLIHLDLEKGNLIEKREGVEKGNVIGNPNSNLKSKNQLQKVHFDEPESGYSDESEGGIATMPKVVTIDSQGEENAVYIPVKARAGYLLGYGDPEYIEKLPAYHLPGHRNGTYRIFEVDGLSMFNTLQDKDKVIARWVPVSEIREDRIHVLITKNDGLLIKRVLHRPQEGKIVCKSDNNHHGSYPTIVLDEHEVLEAWYVVERWTRMLPSPGEIYKRIIDLEADLAIIKQRLPK